MSNQSLAGGGKSICIYKPSCGGVIIAGLEVIEAAFGIVVVSTVAERVLFGQSTVGGQDLAVGVIGITRHGIAAGVHQAHDITLQVRDIVIGGPIDLHGVGLAGVVVEEVMGLRSPAGRYLLLQQLSTGVDVAVRGGRFGFQNSFAGLGNRFAAFLFWKDSLIGALLSNPILVSRRLLFSQGCCFGGIWLVPFLMVNRT